MLLRISTNKQAWKEYLIIVTSITSTINPIYHVRFRKIKGLHQSKEIQQ